MHRFAITLPCTIQNDIDILKCQKRRLATDVDNSEKLVVPLSQDSRVLHSTVFTSAQTTGNLCSILEAVRFSVQ
jgi:hypothetical protein